MLVRPLPLMAQICSILPLIRRGFWHFQSNLLIFASEAQKARSNAPKPPGELEELGGGLEGLCEGLGEVTGEAI